MNPSESTHKADTAAPCAPAASKAITQWPPRIAWLVSLTASALIGLQLLSFGSPAWTPAGYRQAFGWLSPTCLIVGSGAAITILCAEKIYRRFGIRAAIGVLTIAGIMLNLGLHRPIENTWNNRSLFVNSAQINPFYQHGAVDANVSFFAYPQVHKQIIEGDYESAPIKHKRLMTYPPGLAAGYGILPKLATATGSEQLLSKIGIIGVDHPQQLPLPKDPAVMAGAVLSIILKLLAFALLPAAAFWLARTCSFSEEQALRAATAILLVPSFCLYACTPNVIMPLWATCCLATAVSAGRQQSIPWTVAATTLAAIGFAVSYAAAPIILMAFLVILTVSTESKQRTKLITTWVTTTAVWWILFYSWGFEPLSAFLTSMENNQDFYRLANRNALPAMGWNLVLFALFCGPAWFVILLNQAKWKRWFELPESRILLIGIVVLTLTWLSGGARGEVDRNWMGIMGPLVALAAAGSFCTRKQWLHITASAALFLIVVCIRIEGIFAFAGA